jgi:selenocysteine lyase/cysteine desulfurase
VIDRVDPPGIDGHSAFWRDDDSFQLIPDAGRLESFEVNMATKVGLGVAIEYALSWGVEAIAERIGVLATELRERLAGAGYEVLDGGEACSGIVTFRSTTESPESTQAWLSARGINTNVALTQSARLDMDQRGIAAAVRASVHYFNTSEEITALIDALAANR